MPFSRSPKSHKTFLAGLLVRHNRTGPTRSKHAQNVSRPSSVCARSTRTPVPTMIRCTVPFLSFNKKLFAGARIFEKDSNNKILPRLHVYSSSIGPQPSCPFRSSKTDLHVELQVSLHTHPQSLPSRTPSVILNFEGNCFLQSCFFSAGIRARVRARPPCAKPEAGACAAEGERGCVR